VQRHMRGILIAKQTAWDGGTSDEVAAHALQVAATKQLH
jgi:hypothetical protein